MTDYEKAMLIMQAAQLEYLHIIAWSLEDVSERDQRRIKQAPETLVRLLMRECPAAAEVIKP